MDGEIGSDELQVALESDGPPLVVDIRSPTQFRREHISGSVIVPMHELPRQIDRVADEDHVVTVCPHGKASVQAAHLITSFEGFQGRVESLSCGLEGWDGETDDSAGDSSTGWSSGAPF